MSTTSQQLEAARTHVRAHLVECCNEILQYHHTGALPIQCRVREAHCLLVDPVFEHNGLAMVENMVKDEAMKFCVHGR